MNQKSPPRNETVLQQCNSRKLIAVKNLLVAALEQSFALHRPCGFMVYRK